MQQSMTNEATKLAEIETGAATCTTGCPMESTDEVSRVQLGRKARSRSQMLSLLAKLAVVALFFAAPAASTSAPSTVAAASPSTPTGAPSISAGGELKPTAEVQCESRQQGRKQCAAILPRFVVQSESWLVAVQVDRPPTVVAETRRLRGSARAPRASPSSVPKRNRLRGSARSRQTSTPTEVPHQHFITAMERTLHVIARMDPGASVDLAVFSEGQDGEIVDETGVPIEWDISSKICGDLGLGCTETLVLFDKPATSIPEAIACIGAADALVRSEHVISPPADTLATNAEIITDGAVEEHNARETDTPTTNPTKTIIGISDTEGTVRRSVVTEWSACSLSAQDL